jgi:hypothetical protein
LAVSSEWKDVNKKGTVNGMPVDFQAQQIEKIVEAIALTLPAQGGQNTSVMGTISSSDPSTNGGGPGQKYEDYFVRELAHDLGVDPKFLKLKF